MSYQAPVTDLLASMRAVGGFGGDLTPDVAAAVLTEAAQIAEGVLLPLDQVGDRQGVALKDGVLKTAPGWREAYRQWVAGGWLGIAAPVAFGGMGLPLLLQAAAMEIWSSANASFALGPVLTAGAIEALASHGTAAQKDLYLPKLVAGTWTGTMNLTEPQAGSDVGALKTRAQPQPDGSFRITGTKIYITYGEHDLTENIVHLVLARLPDAPSGTRGISLFLVPKFIPDADGRPGARNDVFCAGIEHKLGMHASPTCTMVFGDKGGATGWLIGEPHRGLACMFTMMNNARLAVGLHGVAAAERATQKALAHARLRRQGRSAAAAGPSPIIAHPDVARMLMTMQAQTMAARAICHLTAAAIDAGDVDRAGLLTPIAKAYATDIGNEVASLGVQVHGGMGYIEETGAAQILRDVRIAAIYEGTNGIQAIDLATRKLPLGGGAAVAAEIAAMRAAVEGVRRSNAPAFGAAAERLAEAVDAAEDVVRFHAGAAPADVLAGATATLRLFGLARGGTALAAMALDAASDARLAAITRFFAEQLCPEARALRQAITEGAGALQGAGLVFGPASA